MGVEAYSFMSAEEAAERVRTYAAPSDADKVAPLRQWSDEAGKHRPALLRAVLDRTFAAEGQGYRELTKDLSDAAAAASLAPP